MTLVLSDVVGDDLSTIASGPTVPDPTTFADALAVLRRRGVLDDVARRRARAARRRARGASSRRRRSRATPPSAAAATRIVGSNRLSVEAAAREARRQGLRPLVLTTRLEGEAREVARVLVAVLRECVEIGPAGARLRSASSPAARRRSRCAATARADATRSWRWRRPRPSTASPSRRSWPASPRTASTGRATPPAGSRTTRRSPRAAALGLAPAAAFLAASDTRNYLGPLGDLIVTGPTGTNVVDVVVLLAGPPAGRGL